jgi:hypothetical protein
MAFAKKSGGEVFGNIAGGKDEHAPIINYQGTIINLKKIL